jgi:anti-sigma-K factor RskA
MAPDIHTLAGAYVLDSVDLEERLAFEKHLAECESCRDEVSALQHATAALAMSEATAPPAHLRTLVLAAAEHTPQLPPLTTSSSPAPVVRRRWAPRLLAAAAAVVLLAGVGAVIRVATDDTPSTVTAAQVFDASDAQKKDIPLGTGEVHVALSRELNRIAVNGADMPALPEGRVYQLWLVDQGEATSLAVMEGDATTAVKEIPHAGVLAVTTEPEGGSDQPTSDPILTVDPADL